MSISPIDPSVPTSGPPGAKFRPALRGSDEQPALPGATVRLMRPAEGDARRDSVRISAAFAALVGLVFLLLNFVIYQSARSHLVSERWDQLVACTEEKRFDLGDMLVALHREASFVAKSPALRAWLDETRANPGAVPPPDRSLELERQLDQAASSFDLLAIEVIGPDGNVFANSSTGSLWRSPDAVALARRVARSRRPESGMDHSLTHGKPIILMAVPIEGVEASGDAAVAVVYAGLEERMRSSLSNWIISSPTAGAFIVLRDGSDVVVVSQPPSAMGLYQGQRLPLSSPQARSLAIAAQGGASELESRSPSGVPMWSVTRPMPELGCAIVGQVSRSTMLAGMRMTLLGLLLLDVGAGLLALTVVMLWRRMFRAQIAEREIEFTRNHAGRLQAVLDSAFDAILSLDTGGRVLTANLAAERLFQCPAGELTGRPASDVLAWDGGALPRAVSSEPDMVSRTQARRRDGSEIPVEYTLARSETGSSLFYTLVIRDVSARVDAEHKAQSFAQGLEVSNRRLEEANGQLEQSSRLKSEFLANTSHELRTPLNGIMGFLQLVLDGLCDSRDEERDFLAQALTCSRHLLGLINDVLDIAKIEAGRLALQIEPVTVSDLFDEVYTVTHVQAQQKGLKLRFEPPPVGSPPVRADFGKVKQVLINLVGNSLKFTPHGSITVRVTAREDAGHAWFEVIDTGIGIPVDRQNLIFEKFIQADGSTTRRYGGTGLGLAITRSLIELMGGVIGVESEGPGKGTRMFFSLPIWRGEEELPAASDSGEGPLPDMIQGPAGGPLVLVVDDDPVYRRMVTALLHQNGYRTAEAAHAEGGWVVVRRLRPALVVLDYALSCPEGAVLRTGWDLADRMSGDDRTRQIPFLFVTGFEAQLRERLRNVAFAQQPLHLSKPVNGSELLATIISTLGDDRDRFIRVLLADDDPMVAAFVSKVLPTERFQLDVVNSGEECLHLLRTQPKKFDLLLLDLMMPEASGYDVLREMTLRGTAASLPVIVLTNNPDVRNEDERRLLEQGVVLEVIAKSEIHARPQGLTEAIVAHLGTASPHAATVEAQKLEVERFRAEIPEGNAAESGSVLGVERLSDATAETHAEDSGDAGRPRDDEHERRAA